MRDIKRIDRICNKLKKLWKCYPDQRFGQLISNYIPINFGIEDEEKDAGEKGKCIEAYIDKELKEHKLGERVMNETNYLKDRDEGFEKLQSSGFKAEIGEESPKGEDYIKELKK